MSNLKDRRKQWQKDSINFSWSRCGTVATPRKDENPTRFKRAKELVQSGDCPTLFTWHEGAMNERGYVVSWDRLLDYANGWGLQP